MRCIWKMIVDDILTSNQTKSSSGESQMPTTRLARKSPWGWYLLQRSWVQRPQRHQRSHGNVLVIHQVLLGERQRFHNDSCIVLALCVDQKDDAFDIAARIPLPNFPVEVELYSRLNL